MPIITSAPRVPLPGDRHLLVGTDGGDLSLTVIDAKSATLVSLRIPNTSADRTLFSADVPGFSVAVYRSELGPHTVVDLLTEEPGPVQHSTTGEPVLKVTLNDGCVYNHTIANDASGAPDNDECAVCGNEWPIQASIPWTLVRDAVPSDDETVLLAISTGVGGPLNYSTGFWDTDGDRGYFVADGDDANGSDASNVVAWLALTPPTLA